MLRVPVVVVAGLLAMVALPMAAQAQGIVGGAERGAARGERAAGPVGGLVGGVVGGAVGGVVGGARGVLGLPHRGYHHSFAHRRGTVRHHHRHHRAD